MAEKKYINKNGLQYFFTKIKSIFGNYGNLTNKPKINNVELSDNCLLSDLGIQQTYIGTEEPTDESVKIWINPEGEPTDIPIIGSSDWEVDSDITITDETTSVINIEMKKAYKEVLIFIDLTKNNLGFGSLWWKLNGKNINYSSLQTYRYYYANYKVTPLFTYFTITSTNNIQVGSTPVIASSTNNIEKISSFSIQLNENFYFPKNTKIQILGKE